MVGAIRVRCMVVVLCSCLTASWQPAHSAVETTASIPLKYLDACEVAIQLNQPIGEFKLSDGTTGQVQVPKGLTAVNADRQLNQVTLKGTAQAVDTIRALISQLDLPLAMIQVQAKLVEWQAEADDRSISPERGALLVGEKSEDWLKGLPGRLAGKQARLISEPHVLTMLGMPVRFSVGGEPALMAPPKHPILPSTEGTRSSLFIGHRQPDLEPELFGISIAVQCWRDTSAAFRVAFVIKQGDDSMGGANSSPVCFMNQRVAQGCIKLAEDEKAVIFFPTPQGQKAIPVVVLSASVDKTMASTRY